MNRRDFLKLASAAALPVVFRSTALSPILGSPLARLVDEDSDRVLVLVQLMGGNDGLATLYPLDQMSNLMALRSNIMLPESALIGLRDDLGLHPAMQGLKSVWDQGRLQILQSVGYPNQNRSHFRSQDIWHSASAAEDFVSTGWLGRYLEQDHPGYPYDYPNAQHPDPFALTIGNVVSETCQGRLANYSMALTDPFNPGRVAPGQDELAPEGCYGEQLRFVREVARQTNAYSDGILRAANAGANRSGLYPDENVLARHLGIVARLISGGLQTRIYVVRLGGFDTHGAQVEDGAPETGVHATLLQTLSEALAAFQDDLQQLGVAERVVGMTYSEFGRRIRSNASWGTDHGTAAPLFLFGQPVCPGVVGANPVIERLADIEAGVEMAIDFRDVYGSILADWFQLPEPAVAGLLYAGFQRLPIFCKLPAGSTPTPGAGRTPTATGTAPAATATPEPEGTPATPSSRVYLPSLERP